MPHSIPEEHFKTAEELWERLSPTRQSPNPPNKLIYRGQANTAWKLIPTILRKKAVTLLQSLSALSSMTAGAQVWMEFQMLRGFIHYCDEVGVSVPNDSKAFRDHNLTDLSLKPYHDNPCTWPNEALLATMALARLHGCPTRLLDWTTNAYIAAYFAASEALRIRFDWKNGQRLAVLELNAGPHHARYCGKVSLLTVPGAISANVVAQQGLFTVHPLRGQTEEPIVTNSLEHELPKESMRKLTVPITASYRLYELCERLGYNSARLYPSADGASKAALDRFWYSTPRNLAPSSAN